MLDKLTAGLEYSNRIAYIPATIRDQLTTKQFLYRDCDKNELIKVLEKANGSLQKHIERISQENLSIKDTYFNLQKENAELKRLDLTNFRVIDAQNKAMRLQEQLFEAWEENVKLINAHSLDLLNISTERKESTSHNPTRLHQRLKDKPSISGSAAKIISLESSVKHQNCVCDDLRTRLIRQERDSKVTLLNTWKDLKDRIVMLEKGLLTLKSLKEYIQENLTRIAATPIREATT